MTEKRIEDIATASGLRTGAIVVYAYDHFMRIDEPRIVLKNRRRASDDRNVSTADIFRGLLERYEVHSDKRNALAACSIC